MLGKKGTQYAIWADHARQLYSLNSLDVVNTGSTPAYNAFDYSYWEKKGGNLAFFAQPLYYDFEVLKKYQDRIKRNAVIIICVEEFKLLVDAYDDKKTDHKYYLWLNPEQIRTYNKCVSFFINHIPFIMHPRLLLSEIKLWLTKNSFDKRTLKVNNDLKAAEMQDKKYAQRWFDGWKKEFGFTSDQIISESLKMNISINMERLKEMVRYCYKCFGKTYILVPPFSPNLEKQLPDSILNECLWHPLKEISDATGVEIIDRYNDIRFADWNLYKDALSFNDKGRILFNKVVQNMISFDFGEW